MRVRVWRRAGLYHPYAHLSGAAGVGMDRQVCNCKPYKPGSPWEPHLRIFLFSQCKLLTLFLVEAAKVSAFTG